MTLFWLVFACVSLVACVVVGRFWGRSALVACVVVAVILALCSLVALHVIDDGGVDVLPLRPGDMFTYGVQWVRA